MKIQNITNSILKNKSVLKTLDKISEHGTSFAAGTSLILSLSLRPFSINSTPNVEKENKQYAIANSICSGLIKFGIVESIALPIEHAVKRIDKNPQKYLKQKTIKELPPKAYKLITQTIKLGTGFLTAIPKSMLTISLIPVVMDKLFFKKERSQNNATKNINFTGALNEHLSQKIAQIIDNKRVKKLATKYQHKDKDIAKHITAGTDVLLTSAFAYNTTKSKNIKENRKKALIYNNIISTTITLAGGYTIDHAIKKKSGKFIDHFKKLNATDPKLPKYIEGLNILRPALIFAAIYYGILPMFSTYIAEKADKFIEKQ